MTKTSEQSVNKYYQILGVDTKTKLAEIKTAYRRRAKELHPDINDAEDANEQFALLNEAYEYLQNRRTGKVFNNRNKTYTKPKTTYKNYEQWKRTEQKRAQQRAQYHARMKYAEFVKTDYYKNTVALNILMDFLLILTAFSILIGVPLISYNAAGTSGLYVAAFLLFITVGYWGSVLVQTLPDFSWKELAKAMARISKTKTFHLTAITFLNFFLIAYFGLSTLISIWSLLICFAFPISLSLLLIKKNKKKTLITWGFGPVLVNFLFVINFLLSTNRVLETYNYKHKMERKSGRHTGRVTKQKTTMIILDNGKYEEYLGIRLFLDFEEMKYSNSITYEMADGLFGLRVMKSYRFN